MAFELASHRGLFLGGSLPAAELVMIFHLYATLIGPSYVCKAIECLPHVFMSPTNHAVLLAVRIS